MTPKVVVVTGGNKGIGFAIVRGLCKRFDGDVFLTSRNVKLGQAAVKELEKENLYPKYHQLDITEKESVEIFRDYIKENYGGIDVLINNAAIAFKLKAPDPVYMQAKQTLFVNYFSLLTTCEILIPIVRNGGRIINLSSALGHLSHIPSVELRNKFLDPNLTVPELSGLMNEYIEAARLGAQAMEWGKSSYAVSKVGVAALSRIQQRLHDDRDIKVNAVHPGYVASDLTSHRGFLTTDEGAMAPLYLALDAPDTIRGQYVWCNKEVVRWDGKKPSEKKVK